MTMRKHSLKSAVVGLLVAGVFVSVLAFAYIHFSYDTSMPRVPDPADGRIYRLVVNHGDLVYVNRQELDRADFVFHYAFGLGLVCVLGLAFVRQYWT